MPYPNFRLVRCDVTDFIHVPGEVDLVLHFASPASPVDYLRLPIQTLKVGSLGTLHALGLAREKKARFVLASTSEVYGDLLEHPQRETYWGNVNPVGPRGVYDEAKRYAQALTTAYQASHGVDTAIVRIFNTYGPRMRPDDGRAIPTFIRQALAGEPITVTGDGSQTRSICYVDDTVRGILALAAAGHHAQPTSETRRDIHPGTCPYGPGHDPCLRADTAHRPACRRSQSASARHRPGRESAGLEAADSSRERAAKTIEWFLGKPADREGTPSFTLG